MRGTFSIRWCCMASSLQTAGNQPRRGPPFSTTTTSDGEVHSAAQDQSKSELDRVVRKIADAGPRRQRMDSQMRWIAKRQTTALAEDLATLVVVPHGATISVEIQDQVIRCRIEATGENCWMGR